MSYQSDFHKKPHALQLSLSLCASEHLVNGRSHTGDDTFNGGMRHTGTSTVSHLDQPQSLQCDQRFANGRPPNAEAHLQIALGRQSIARA